MDQNTIEKKRVAITLQSNVVEVLDKVCRFDGESKSEIIERLLVNYLNVEFPKKPKAYTPRDLKDMFTAGFLFSSSGNNGERPFMGVAGDKGYRGHQSKDMYTIRYNQLRRDSVFNKRFDAVFADIDACNWPPK